MTVVNFNGNNITITGKGFLFSEEIRRIDFDSAHVEINGFKSISKEASWYLDDADTIQLAEEVTDINGCYFKKAKVNHPGMFINRKGFKDLNVFKDLNDLKTSLELQCHCSNDFVYSVYPAEHRQWNGTVVHGYHLSMCEVIHASHRPIAIDEDLFIEVETIREPIHPKTTKVKQVLKAMYPLDLKSTEVKDFASFVIGNARDTIIHLGNPDRKWLVNEYHDAPTYEELMQLVPQFDGDSDLYIALFEHRLLRNKEDTLEDYGLDIFLDEDLQAICKSHIDDFKIRIYEQDANGPVVVGFYANGKDYAF